MIRILSLDDEPQMLDILSLVLRHTGCEHLTTNDNYEAWALLHTMPVHLFTQDLMRPEMDGWQFLYYMQADATLPDVPVIIITANTQSASRARATNTQHIAAYLTKPFRTQELLSVVWDVLAHHYDLQPPTKSFLAPGRKDHEDLAGVKNLRDLAPENVRNALWWALRSPPYPAANLLMSALIECDNDLRFMIARALGSLDLTPAETTTLLQALYHEDWNVRWSAALALGRQREQKAILPLIVALNDEHPVVRMWAALALGRIGDGQATEALTMSLLDDAPSVRQATVLALGWIHDPQAVNALGMALNDVHDIVRIMAAQALNRFGSACNVEALRSALDDSNPNVREIAAQALGRIKDQRAINALLHALHDPVFAVSASAARALVYIGEPARAPLLEKLSDRDPQVRRAIVAALRYVQDNTIIPLLINALKNEVSTVRSMAAQTLGNFHNRQAVKEAVPALTATLEDENFNVAWAAATALRRLGYTSAHPAQRSTNRGN